MLTRRGLFGVIAAAVAAPRGQALQPQPMLPIRTSLDQMIFGCGKWAPSIYDGPYHDAIERGRTAMERSRLERSIDA